MSVSAAPKVGEGSGVTPKGIISSLTLLTLIQGILAQFMMQGVPLFMREAGHSAQTVGLIYVAAIPYVARFLWAPLVDRKGMTSIGHFRSWILGGQILSCASLLFLAFIDIETFPFVVVGVCLIVMIGLAFNVTATGGLAVEKLAPQDRARGSANIAAAAALAGFLLGGGVLYFLADLGWQATVFGLFGICGLFCIISLSFRLDKGSAAVQQSQSYLKQFSLLVRPDTRLLLFTTVAILSGLAVTFGLKSILLIDAGYSVREASFISLIYGNGAGLIAALCVRRFVELWGGYFCLCVVGILCVLFCGSFAVIFRNEVTSFSAGAFAILANCLLFASYPAGRTLLMSMCREGQKATDYTVFVSFEGFALLIYAALSNLAFEYVGFSAVAALGACISAAGAVVAWRNHVRDPHKRTAKQRSRTDAAHISTETAEEILSKMSLHLAEHGIKPEVSDKERLYIKYKGCKIHFDTAADGLKVEVRVPLSNMLFFLKEAITREISSIDPATAEAMRWQSDGRDDQRRPANFYEMTLLRKSRPVQGVLRLTLETDGEGLSSAEDGYHVKLMVPADPKREPVWPGLRPNGTTAWPRKENRLHVRYFTVRHIRSAGREVDIDIVDHPGGRLYEWAIQAKTGDRVGLMGPVGLETADLQEPVLMAGDMTALPAMARMIENMPPAMKGVAFLAFPEGGKLEDYFQVSERAIDIQLIDRDKFDGQILDKMKRMREQSDFKTAWFGGEHSTAKVMEAYFQHDCGFEADQYSCSTYWRRGEVSDASQ